MVFSKMTELFEGFKVVSGDKARADLGRMYAVSGEIGRSSAYAGGCEETIERDEHIRVFARELAGNLNLRVEVDMEEIFVRHVK